MDNGERSIALVRPGLVYENFATWRAVWQGPGVFSFREGLALAVPSALLVSALIGVPVMVLGPNGLPRHRRLAAQLHAQLEENRRLARQVLQLQAELDALEHDPRARERAVREELGWVRPDEIVVEVPTVPRQ